MPFAMLPLAMPPFSAAAAPLLTPSSLRHFCHTVIA